MSPLVHLYLVVAVTLAAYGLSRLDRARHRRVLRRVAAELGLNYSPSDQFRLAAKVADRFPVPGAASLRVADLVYGMDGGGFRYVFTAEYTVGAVRMKKRLRRVAAYVEPATLGPDGPPGDVTLAPSHLGLADQYRAAAGGAGGGGAKAAVVDQGLAAARTAT